MRTKFLLVLISFFVILTPARAEVLATFYSHDFDGAYFPHAFVRLQGTVESTGEQVDTNYGFTAKRVSPRILLGSVYGMIETKKAKYVSKSRRHFTIRMNEQQYERFLQMVTEWRNLPGKSYNLGKRNCVHFTMEAAAMLGLQVNRKSKFFKKPKSFLNELMSLNPRVGLIDPPAPVHIASKP